MQPVVIKNLKLGDGIPKICVPLTGSNQEKVLQQAKAALLESPDLIEWRVDFLDDLDLVDTIADPLASLMQDTPLLLTFRTQAEGGAMALSADDYQKFICHAAVLPSDLIDIELFAGDFVPDCVTACHAQGKTVILSNHDFHHTPASEEMLHRLQRMEEIGADIAKIAVMPESTADVLRLMQVTDAFLQTAQIPAITMAMGNLGMISRVSGALTGSAVTFGTVGEASAPGQIPVQDLRKILKVLQN